MLKRYRSAAIGCAALLVSGALAFAAGNYQGYPIIGQPSICNSTVTGASTFAGATGQGQATNGSVCASSGPAGPFNITDEELINVDTGVAQPASANVPSGMLGALNLKVNRLVGGDFGTNLWQRAASTFANASPTAAIMTADRWWAISASNVVTITKSTPASSAADFDGANGFYSWMRVARPSGTPSGATCIGQTLEQQAAAPLIGKNAILSFRAYAPATFSATNFNITVTVAYFTAADAAATQGTIGFAGGNSSTFALSASGQGGGITGYVAAVAGTSPGTTGTVASGVATIPLSAIPTGYSVYAPIPATNAAGTAVTSVGVAICATPTLATTVSTDYFEINALQLQGMPSAATNVLPAGIISPTGYERRSAAVEQANQLYYSFVANETAVLAIRGVCDGVTTSIDNCLVTFPQAMRLIPLMKYTAGFAATTTTGQSAVASCTGLATASSAAFTVTKTQALLACTSSAATPAAGVGGWFTDNSGGGVISASAEP